MSSVILETEGIKSISDLEFHPFKVTQDQKVMVWLQQPCLTYIVDDSNIS